jgi:hypothetical protein
LFGLDGRITGRLGIDLHLHVGDVRHGIDRQAFVVVDAERRCANHQGQHQPAVFQAVP